MSLFFMVTGLPIQYWQSISRMQPRWPQHTIFLSGHVPLRCTALPNSIPRPALPEGQNSHSTLANQTCIAQVSPKEVTSTNHTDLSHCSGARYFLHLALHFSELCPEMHKAFPGTMGHLWDIVKGTVTLAKLCKASDQKYLLAQSSKQWKKWLWPRTEPNTG